MAEFLYNDTLGLIHAKREIAENLMESAMEIEGHEAGK